MNAQPPNNQESTSNNVGLRIVFSEKALIALLKVILVTMLGVNQFQSNNNVNPEIPAQDIPEQLVQ